MAQIPILDITGSLRVGTTADLTSVGNLWYCTSNNSLYLSYCNGSSIVACNLGGDYQL